MSEAITLELDLAAALGADGDISTQQIALYIPNKDQHGRELGTQRRWVLEAIQLLCELNGGATALPPVEGGWLNDAEEIIWEHPVIVYSFIRPDSFVAGLPRLREFLHRLGRETNQGEIGFEFDGCFYRIRNFTTAEKEAKR